MIDFLNQVVYASDTFVLIRVETPTACSEKDVGKVIMPGDIGFMFKRIDEEHLFHMDIVEAHVSRKVDDKMLSAIEWYKMYKRKSKLKKIKEKLT